MKLKDLEVYLRSIRILFYLLSEEVWSLVSNWKYFERSTIGNQLVRAADSISSNISEGFGRFHYKEKKHFAYYSRGSLYETQTWISKAHNRKLINDSQFEQFQNDLSVLGKMLNAYINSIGIVGK